MKIFLIGAFGFNDVKKYCGGQPVKSRELYSLLVDNFTEASILYNDTYAWKKNPLLFLIKTIRLIKKADIIIILPAQNGLKVLSRLVKIFKRKNTKVFYDVIGGWLPDYLLESKETLNNLKRFNGIWVETPTMQKKLNVLGLNNVETIPNFKNLPFVKEYCGFNNIFQVCTFSRVSYSKGVEDAISAVSSLSKLGIRIKLDIYGPIEEKYKEKFDKVLKENDSTFINYKGIVNASKSTEIISKYNALLFPTFYEGEGFAGTLIDAMFSGVPVIASDWRYNCDIIKNGFNGLIFKTRDVDDLISKIKILVYDPKLCILIHDNCLKEAKKYTKESVLLMISNEFKD